MAMSLKKITAIAVGGAMVASTLATGVAAAEVVTLGDIDEFMKNVVKDGKPNVDIVVGSKGAAMDVVAAADIAAKIGSMCYKDVKIEDGLAKLKIETSADTELSENLNRYNDNSQFFIFTTPERSYTENLGKGDHLNGLVEDKANASMEINESNIKNGRLIDVNMSISYGNITGETIDYINLTDGSIEEMELKDGKIKIKDGAAIIGGVEASIDIANMKIDNKNVKSASIKSSYIAGVVDNNNILANIGLKLDITYENNTTATAEITGKISGQIGNSLQIQEGKITVGSSEYTVTAETVSVDLTQGKIEILNIKDADNKNKINKIEFNISKVIKNISFKKISFKKMKLEDGTISKGKLEKMTILNADATFNGTVRYNDTTDIEVQKLSRLSTLIKDSDADPDDLSNETDADAIEFLLTSANKIEDKKFKIGKGDLVYGSLIFKDEKNSINGLQPLYIGMEIPLLGEMYRVIDVNGNSIYLGKEVYAGNINEGKSYDLGNGYEIKVKKILKSIGKTKEEIKVEIEIIKDGKVVTSKTGKVPFEIVYKDIGIRVYEAYSDLAGYNGYVSLIIAKDVKEYKLGEEFVKNWKLYAITKNGAILNYTDSAIVENKTGIEKGDSKTEFLHVKDDATKCIYGLALRYEGDDIEIKDSGKTVDFVNKYAILEFTDDGDPNAMFARYKMEIEKDLSLKVGEDDKILGIHLKLEDIQAVAHRVVPVKTPVAKLDTEASLDTDKYLILVGGPVVNKLTEELQKQGKINIDNNSPPTLVVVDGKILVVAGGDRYKTRKAALELIQNY